MTNYNFYAKVFALFTSKNLHFLVLSFIINCQSLVAQAPYDYWQLETYGAVNNTTTSWSNSIAAQSTNKLQNLDDSLISSTLNGCVGKGIMIKHAQVLASTGSDMITNADLGPNMAFEFLMKPNPTNGESKFLLGTQFGFLQWTTEGFVVTTLFKNAQNIDKSWQIAFPFDGLYKASPDYYTDGNWHHIVVNVIVATLGPKLPTLQLWVDGQMMIDSAGTIPFKSFNSYRTPITASNHENKDLAIDFTGACTYDGFIDEIALYTHNLSPNIIYQHYKQTILDNPHNHYTNTSYPNPHGDTLYFVPSTIQTDRREFSPTISTATGALSGMDTNGNPYDDAIEEFKRFPMPRFKKEANGDIPLLRNHPNFISPTLTKFYIAPNTDPTKDYPNRIPKIVWGDIGGNTPINRTPIYGGRTTTEIHKANMAYLHTELYDKWNYNLMLNGFATASICDAETSDGVLLQTALQNPSKPLTVNTYMSQADGNQGVTGAADFIYSPIIVNSGDTIAQAEENYVISFDNNTINCHIYKNATGYNINVYGYDTNYNYIIIVNNVINGQHLLYNTANAPTPVTIKIRKYAPIPPLNPLDFVFTLTGTEEFVWGNNNPTPCIFTGIGKDNSAALPVRIYTTYPVQVTFNYESTTLPQFDEMIELQEPSGMNMNHQFTFTCPAIYDAIIYEEDIAANLYYKIISNPTSVSGGSSYTTGGSTAKSYRIVLTHTNNPLLSYTIAFNLSI